MERGKEMKIKIERKSFYTHQIVEIENQTLFAETHHLLVEVWCTIEFGERYNRTSVRTPMGGTLEISAI
jgi:hypothetical protein